MRTMRTGWTGMVVAGALTALAAAAPLGAVQGGSVDDREAERLEAEAARLAMDMATVGRAASLYRKAAELREEGDPLYVQDLVRAGRMAYHARRHDRAVEDLSRAGETALAWGDVATAAHAFMEAAWIADRQGDGRLAYDLGLKAHRLGQSPLLDEETRRSIREGIVAAGDDSERTAHRG